MPLRGEFTPPGDKSISHRAVLLSILAEGEMTVTGLSDGLDVKSSLGVFRALGGQARGGATRWVLKGLGGRLVPPRDQAVELDCGNSGTTMRLAGGLLAGRSGHFLLDGDQQLRRRPMERLADPLRQMGARVATTNGHAPLTITGGGLHGLEYVNHEGSAQIKGAVLLAGLSAGSPTRVVEPIPTRDHTEKMINAFGGQVIIHGSEMEVIPGPLTLPPTLDIPGDPSAAAIFLIGAAVMPGSRVTARNTLLSHGRIGFLRVLDRMGANVSISLEQDRPEPTGHVTVEYAGPLSPTEITREEVPSLIDEIPILALAAAAAQGLTVFRQVRELRLKETDRLTAIKHQLGALGVRVEVKGDDLMIAGPTRTILPDALDSGHDHRLAMAFHLARLVIKGSFPIIGEESIPVSYPAFQADLARLYRA